MATQDDESTAGTYRHSEDACLARTADAITFGPASPDAAAAAAERRVNPFRRVLAGLFRGLGGRDRQ